METTHKSRSDRHSAFDVNKDDMDLIVQIRDRAHATVFRDHPNQTGMQTLMDLCVAHTSCPLKLRELLAASPLEFSHDIVGIRHHVNRETLQLEGFFLPRYARANDS